MTATQRPRLALALPWAWLGLFVATPAIMVALIAWATATDDVPPYAVGFDPSSLLAVVTDPYYRDGFLGSVRIAAISSLLCLLLGYPLALAIARTRPRWRPVLLVLVMVPFWTGFLLRIAAWIGLLRDDGWLDAAVAWLGLPPPHLMHTETAMYLGIVHAYLPFMVLPLEARLARADPLLEQAAADLGASRARVFRTVTLPLSWPGVVAGVVLVFVPVTGEYVIPQLLGDPATHTLGQMIWSEFFDEHDWPRAASLTLALTTLLLTPALIARFARRST